MNEFLRQKEDLQQQLKELKGDWQYAIDHDDLRIAESFAEGIAMTIHMIRDCEIKLGEG
jgi:hypothetical protein